jgi:hypothetical protein
MKSRLSQYKVLHTLGRIIIISESEWLTGLSRLSFPDKRGETTISQLSQCVIPRATLTSAEVYGNE